MVFNDFEWNKLPFEQLVRNREAVGHALLIHGPRGVGKLAFAMGLAQAFLCEQPDDRGVPCGACHACGWFDAGNHPDFRCLEPERLVQSRGEAEEGGEKGSREILVGQVRALADFIGMTSHRGGDKVIVIHPAEALNIEAANALLKNLEEPPPGTRFLLVAHRPGYLPATVLSRCRKVPLGKPDPASAVEWLRRQGVADPALALAHTGNAPLLARELAQAEFWQQRELLLKNLCSPAFDALATAESIRDYEVEAVVGWLQKWTFDLLLQRSVRQVRYNPDFAGEIQSLAAGIDTLALLRYHRDLIRLQRVVQHPLNARLLFEQLLFDYQDAIAPTPRHASRAA
jgi:DNA polymerase-3 subunit delta'